MIKVNDLMRTVNDMIQHIAPVTNAQSRYENPLIAVLDREVVRCKRQHADHCETEEKG